MIKFLRTKNNIYCVVDAFRHILDPPRHMNIPFQEPCVIFSYEKEQLPDQDLCFLFGYEL